MSNPEEFDMNTIMQQAQEMQQQMLEAQEKQAEQTLIGTAGGEKVKVTVTGTGDFTAVEISPEVVDPNDIEMLQELVLAATRDAVAKVSALQMESMPDLGALGGGLGGMLGE